MCLGIWHVALSIARIMGVATCRAKQIRIPTTLTSPKYNYRPWVPRVMFAYFGSIPDIKTRTDTHAHSQRYTAKLKRNGMIMWRTFAKTKWSEARMFQPETNNNIAESKQMISNKSRKCELAFEKHDLWKYQFPGHRPFWNCPKRRGWQILKIRLMNSWKSWMSISSKKLEIVILGNLEYKINIFKKT